MKNSNNWQSFNTQRSKTKGWADISFLNSIVNKIEEFQIPPLLTLNIDQINSKYVSMDKVTMTKKDSTSLPIRGLSDKRSITVTFTVTLNGIFLSTQLIYGGKIVQSLPKFKLPKGFSLSANVKHCSGTAESKKLSKKLSSHRWISIFSSRKCNFDIIKKLWGQKDVER